MYSRSATGLSPESVVFNGCTDFSISKTNPTYMLRPEAIESFYYLNKLTGDPVYRVSHKLVKNTAPILLSPQSSRHCTSGMGLGNLSINREVLQDQIWIR